MKHNPLLLTVIPALAAVIPAKGEAKGHEKPNIIFILTDDMGKGDLSCYGNPHLKTPNIDAIGENGIRMEHFRVESPISGPSRVSLLTGRYSDRSGHRMTHVEKTSSLDEPWLPRQLNNGGYSTAAMGKWHLGDLKFKARGFDHWVITSPGGWSDFYNYPILRTGEKRMESDPSYYATDFLTDEAIRYVTERSEARDGKPFFLYLAYNAPHFPLQCPEEDVAPFRGKGLTGGAEVIYGMIARLDKNIGRLMCTLKEQGVYDNTIIVFASDNGPYFGTYKGLDQKRWNCDLAGEKEYVLEGGINVPCLVQWPAGIKNPGHVRKNDMHAVDWAPTLLDAAGIKPSGRKFDGVSHLSALTGKGEVKEPVRFWCYNKAYPTDISNCAMIDGKWKIYRPHIDVLNRWDNKGQVPENITPSEWQLFDLMADPGETKDLAAQYPDRVKAMVAVFEAWWSVILKENIAISGNW